ncbi:aryl hydrocarbon receptor 1b [Lampris incognitus]|uniref:aryl hydrocarbon receptor 1b n=1 Tax=Lampris incognitus TaxID=2546036 RepID=UPI0024B56692|nr:aryl hydrocarbon receptor 1b [Lampris incognitus]
MYAGRKRRKPVQRTVKQAPADGAKSNPSKRHRDRLNSELDRLASLLPFAGDVTSSLDKLSILRLSVSYLRTKSFFSVALKSQPSNDATGNRCCHDNRKTTEVIDSHVPEGELLLQALNGFVLVVTAEGIVFFSSHTIQDYLGFHQTDVMHQSVFDLIHTEDQHEFMRNLHWALNPPAGTGADPTTATPAGPSPTHSVHPPPVSTSLVTYDPDQLPPENSSFLERSFVCRFRCLLDNSSGFLAMNLQGRLKFLHGQTSHHRQAARDGSATRPQLALFAIATPLQPPAILEIRTRNMIFRTKHKLDFTPMACDAKGKLVLGYTEAELRVRGSGYQFIHAADMLYCAENHIRMIKTGESGLTVFRLLTKDNQWKWVQANARLVYKNGKPDYIIATQRPLLEEEGGEHLRKRSMHLPFTFATGEALLYHTSYPLHGFPDSSQGKSKGGNTKKSRLDRSSKDELDPNSLLGALMSQDESVYVCQADTEPKASYHGSLFSEQQQRESDGFGGSLGGSSWNTVANGLTVEQHSEPSSYDPLLSTLDSLSLEEDVTCSNSELFSALENLGLNAEDLELLLLDERMIKVELDQSHIPTLSDLLTNNEILSYIQDSLENEMEGEEPWDRPESGLVPQPHTPPRHPPITHLSQQMQQHIDGAQLVEASPWAPQSEGRITSPPQPCVADTNSLTEVHNGQSVENISLHPIHPQTVLSVSQLNGEHKHLNHLLQSNQPWQVAQDHLLVHLQGYSQIKQTDSELNGAHTPTPWPGRHDQLDPTTNGAYLTHGHTNFTQSDGHTDYNMADIVNTDATAMNSVPIPEICHSQGAVSATQSYQLPGHQQEHQQQTQFPASCLPQCPMQNPAVNLDQLLSLSQPQNCLPSLEAYSVFNTTITHETARTKLENGCILSTTNAAYLKSCLMPNGNGMATDDFPISCPEGLPALQDPQETGFYL